MKHSSTNPSRTLGNPSAADTLKTTCLINNFNYADYINDAVASALNQELPFDEIILVDDGSTDGSVERVEQRFGSHPRLTIICSDHGGQMTAIQAGVSAASGDILYFLDSDDLYTPQLTARVQSVYQQYPSVEFVSVGRSTFGRSNPPPAAINQTRDLGVSTIAAVEGRRWVGAPTSCLSMRSDLARRLLPYPRHLEWPSRADDVLVFGSSIAGAHKFHLGESLVHYRCHANNHFDGRSWSAVQKMRHALRLNRLVAHFVERFGYDTRLLVDSIRKEFRSIERPTARELSIYLRIAWTHRRSSGGLCKDVHAVLRHYWDQSRRLSDSPTPLHTTGNDLPPETSFPVHSLFPSGSEADPSPRDQKNWAVA